ESEANTELCGSGSGGVAAQGLLRGFRWPPRGQRDASQKCDPRQVTILPVVDGVVAHAEAQITDSSTELGPGGRRAPPRSVEGNQHAELAALEPTHRSEDVLPQIDFHHARGGRVETLGRVVG